MGYPVKESPEFNVFYYPGHMMVAYHPRERSCTDLLLRIDPIFGDHHLVVPSSALSRLGNSHNSAFRRAAHGAGSLPSC